MSVLLGLDVQPTIPIQHSMPRRPPEQNTAALEAGREALDLSLRAATAQLRKEEKAAWVALMIHDCVSSSRCGSPMKIPDVKSIMTTLP